MTRALNEFGVKEGLFRNGVVPTEQDYLKDLAAVISVRIPTPAFKGATKTRLVNKEVAESIETEFYKFFFNYLNENPRDATTMVNLGRTTAAKRQSHS